MTELMRDATAARPILGTQLELPLHHAPEGHEASRTLARAARSIPLHTRRAS